MKTSYTHVVPALMAVALAIPGLGNAQNPGYGASVQGAALITPDRIGAGDLFGFGARFVFAPNPWGTIGIGTVNYRQGEVVTGAAAGRRFTAWAPAVDLEAVLVGKRTQMFGVLSPSLVLFSLEEMGAAPEQRVTVPTLGAGVGIRLPLAGGLSFDVVAQDHMTWGREAVLEGNDRGDRALGHSPSLTARINLVYRKRDRIARFEDLPISFGNEFRPVRAGAIQDPDLARTAGREHVHQPPAVERSMDAPFLTRALVHDMLLGTVYFRSGSFDVDATYQSVVRDVAEFMRANPDAKVIIRGFTSPDGNVRYNLTLSERRANKIRDQLVYFYEIDKARVDAVTGGTDPEASPEAARRVEIRVQRVVERR
jgi:outer membrane protein OmpA-like peptidoglycan-associated protein